MAGVLFPLIGEDAKCLVQGVGRSGDHCRPMAAIAGSDIFSKRKEVAHEGIRIDKKTWPILVVGQHDPLFPRRGQPAQERIAGGVIDRRENRLFAVEGDLQDTVGIEGFP